MEFCQEIVGELMNERRNKLPFFQRGNRAMSLILSGVAHLWYDSGR
jgi:hypothetical protein